MVKKTRKKGHEEGQAAMLKSFVDGGMSIEEISKITKMPTEDINKPIRRI